MNAQFELSCASEILELGWQVGREVSCCMTLLLVRRVILLSWNMRSLVATLLYD